MLSAAAAAGLAQFGGMKLASMQIDSKSIQLIGKSTIGGLAYGVSSALSGQDFFEGFAQGAAIGAAGYLFNEAKNHGWHFDFADHGGPHYQRTVGGRNVRYDAIDLSPIEHKGYRPPELSKNEVKKLMKSEAWAKGQKKVPFSNDLYNVRTNWGGRGQVRGVVPNTVVQHALQDYQDAYELHKTLFLGQ